jgi:hypothetical protein
MSQVSHAYLLGWGQEAFRCWKKAAGNRSLQEGIFLWVMHVVPLLCAVHVGCVCFVVLSVKVVTLRRGWKGQWGGVLFPELLTTLPHPPLGCTGFCVCVCGKSECLMQEGDILSNCLHLKDSFSPWAQRGTQGFLMVDQALKRENQVVVCLLQLIPSSIL